MGVVQRVGLEQRRGRQKAGVVVEKPVGLVVGGHHVDRAQVRHVQRLAVPAVIAVGEAQQARDHVVEHVDDDRVVGRRDAGNRRAGVGLEDHAQLGFAGLETLHGTGNQRTLPEGLAADFPVRFQFHQQLAVEHAGQLGVFRDMDAPDLAVDIAVVMAREEIGHANDQVVVIVAVPEAHAAGGDVGLLALEDELGILARLAAPPQAHRARIARVGHFGVVERRAVKHTVSIAPADTALGFGYLETVFDERAAFQVELAPHRRVGAADGKPDQAAVVVRITAVRAGPHPVLTFGLGQRIHI